MKNFVIKSNLEVIEATIAEIVGILEETDAKEIVCDLRLIMSEIIINAHAHGNKSNETKKIFISYKIKGNEFIMRIRDEGEGFNPDEVPDPLLLENLNKTSGRGLFLVKRMADEINFHGNGNDIEIIRKILR